MARRLSSPVFVGRSDEFTALLAAARAAEDARPSIVLVGGEAGVGKSRLVAEAATRLRDDGWLVLEGGSVALGDDALPFGPIVEVLRALARDVDSDTIAAAAGPTLPVLARLVPELLPLAPAADGSGDTSSSSGADWLQIRIFEGMLSLLDRLGVERPVLLVVEDLHWADRSTRDLLAFLWRNMRTERLCIVGTFRSDDLHRRHPLTAWLAEAERQPHVDRLDLGRFERRELIDLLTGILGSPPTATLLASIARRSDGNAFFAEELVAASDPAAGAREHLPETLRGVLLVRLSQARDTAAHLIEVAAVAGREVEHDVLTEVSGASAADLATAVREAVDAQLLVVDRTADVERYQFRHALVQEAAYDQLLPSERRALHAAYARAMASRPVPGGGAAEASRLVEIAHHWTAAHEPARALPAAIAAGDASRAVFAYGEASRQYELAIELWDLAEPADLPAGRDLVALFDAASASANLVGDASRAVDHARHALDLVDARSPGTSAADREARALARERLGAAVGLAGDTAISIQALEEAVELLEGTEASPTRARILAGLAANLMLAARASESIGFAREAMEMARTIGDPAIESRAMSILGVDLATLGDIGGGIELLRGSVALANPADDPTIVPRAYANLGSVLEMGGFVEEALEVALTGADQIARFGSELGFLTFLEVNAAAMLIELARYPEAADLLDRNASRALPGLATIHVYTTLAHLAIRTGDLAAARRHLAAAESEAGRIADAQFVIDLCACATEIADWDGDPAAAVAIAHDGFERLAEMDDGVILGQLAIPAIRAAADIAVAARSARDQARAVTAVGAARDIIERYQASTKRLISPDALAIQEIAWRMDLCNAELARASGDDRPEHWAGLRPALAGRPSPFLEAYALWRQAEAHSGANDPAAAATALREASALARRIGAALLVDRIDGLARRLRIDLQPDPAALGTDAPVAPPPPAEEPAGPADPFGLTTREREVLELVAEGYTNRRIADALFISESTAGVHVSHILAKLGVESRTEAATIAVRLGLDRAAV